MYVYPTGSGLRLVHPAFATAATHNNFSFNFSILSVIYTCHAMTELGPVPWHPHLLLLPPVSPC